MVEEQSKFSHCTQSSMSTCTIWCSHCWFNTGCAKTWLSDCLGQVEISLGQVNLWHDLSVGQAHFWLLNYNHRNTNFNRIEIYLLVNDIKSNFHLDKRSVNTPINFFVLWPFHLLPWASYLMTLDPGQSNICSIVNYATINTDTNGIMLKVACYMSFIFSSFINGVEPNFLDQHFCVLDNQNL